MIKILEKLSLSDIFWDKIVSIKKVKGEPYVYDLTIPNCHNFIGNGIFVHNSNCGDAVNFVLGRASSKHLRAKKAQDLIFHGSKSKPAADTAKVNLVFSNKGKALPVGEDSVTVTRTLNKEGVSSYRMNGKISTRQQILDIFIQARLNPGGHNIMRQGDVSKMIDMNPIERRGIIDEISGIAEYDEKRDKAFRELEKVEVKVREAEIILEQKEQIVEKLRKDRDSALEYDRLQKELELVKSPLVWKEYTSVEKNMGSIGSEIEERERSLVTLEAEMKKIDSEMSSREKEMENLMKEVMRKDQIEITSRVSKLESSIESKENLIESNIREVQRLNEMIRSISMLSRDVSPNLKPVLQMSGVRGFVKDLVVIPEKYRIAAEVAAGPHMNDIVVDSLQTAITCVRYLKENRVGRARFLPLDKIRASSKAQLPDGTLGWLSDLVHHEREYTSIAEYVFGTTACVNDLDKAKRIAEKSRSRMVTLDGDLFETSGALFGGFYTKHAKSLPETKKYSGDMAKLEEENKILRLEIEEIEKQLGPLRKQVRDTKTFDFESRMAKIKGEIARLSERRREAYDRKAATQEEINRLRINRARYEANFENLNSQWEESKKKWDSLSDKEAYQKKGLQMLKDSERDILSRISALGPVNMKSIDEFDSLFGEFEEFRGKVDRIVSEKESIMKSINEIESRKRELFNTTMTEMSRLFKDIYRELTSGEAELGLEKPEDINSGLMISAQPPGKKLLYIDSMSGGEKALTALAFLFTIQQFKPSPFYVLDEVDAPLDKPNTKRVIDMVRKQSKKVQFIIVSHNSEMVKAADIVYGISMEDGESKLIGIKLPDEKGGKELTAGQENYAELTEHNN
jgi:chromosome segregation protein